MTVKKKLEIVGVPSDLGANIRGSNMGPAAIRIANLKRELEIQGYQVKDQGDINVPIRDALDEDAHREKFLTALTGLCQTLSDTTYDILKRQNFPIIIGGDHSIAIGSIAGISRYFNENQRKLGLVWIDAHADVNTPESSPSGNIHGMPLAVLLGKGFQKMREIGGVDPKLRAQNVALIGIRTIDDEEKRVLKNLGINYYTMRDIDERGMFNVMQDAIKQASDGTDGIHVSFDIDGIDPRHAPGVSTPVSGGLTFREAHLALEMLYETNRVCSLEIVELNPSKDIGSQSAKLAVDLILSALGKSIV